MVAPELGGGKETEWSDGWFVVLHFVDSGGKFAME
jgi:hypothetical protein